MVQVITMNEKKKLDEAIRRDEQENSHWKRRHHDESVSVVSSTTSGCDSSNTASIPVSKSERERESKGGSDLYATCLFVCMLIS